MPKKSVYLTDESITTLRLPAADSDNDREYSLSGRINAILARYDKLVAANMPEFSRDEWCAIFDANNGTLFEPMFDLAGLPTMVWANVADSRGLGEKWSIDQEALIAKLRAVSPSQAVAIIEAIDRFWSNPNPMDEALKNAGVITGR